MTWQLILAGWAVGAFAAFPSLLEFMDLPVDGFEPPSPWVVILTAVVAAVLWPVAWLALIVSTIRDGGDR